MGIGRREDRLKELSEELRGCFTYLVADLSKLEGIYSAVSYVEGVFDRVDLLVNNAGFGVYGGVLQHSDEEIVSLVNVNFLAPVLLTKRLLRVMGRGSVAVFVVTAGIHVLMRELPIYGASKLALHYVIEALRPELEEKGIRVLAVYPGLVRSEFHRRAGRDVEGGVDPARVAREVVRAISKGRRRLYVPRYLAITRVLGPYLPVLK